MVQIKNGELSPQALISLRSVSGLSSIDINGSVKIGPLVTAAELCQHPELGRNFPLLVEVARELGSPQIRNVATIGGNLCNCSPCADLALPLLVLDAKVKLDSLENIETIPIEDFFRGPGESCLSSEQILTEIQIEPLSPQAKAVFMKKGRVKMDLAVASTAVLLEIEGKKCRRARIAAGAAAPVPLRLLEVESLLAGKELSPEILLQVQSLAEKCISPITDIRGTEEYRRRLIGVFIKRSIERIIGWSSL